MENTASPPKESPAGSPPLERASKSPVQRTPSPAGAILPPETEPLVCSYLETRMRACAYLLTRAAC